GYVRATMAHSERLQRESNQEAENQRNGDFAPVFLKPFLKPDQIDIGFYQGRQPPKFEPDYQPVASLDETTYADDERATLADIVADTAPAENAEAREEERRIEADHLRFLAIVEAMRPSLSQKETAVLDNWLLGPMTIAEVAGAVEMTKSGVSKMAA